MYKLFSASLRAIIFVALLLAGGTQSAIAESAKTPVMVPPAKILIKQRDFPVPGDWYMASDGGGSDATSASHGRWFIGSNQLYEADFSATVYATEALAADGFKRAIQHTQQNGAYLVARTKPALPADQYAAAILDGLCCTANYHIYYTRVKNVVISLAYATDSPAVWKVLTGCERLMIVRITKPAAGGKCNMLSPDYD